MVKWYDGTFPGQCSLMSLSDAKTSGYTNMAAGYLDKAVQAPVRFLDHSYSILAFCWAIESTETWTSSSRGGIQWLVGEWLHAHSPGEKSDSFLALQLSASAYSIRSVREIKFERLVKWYDGTLLGQRSFMSAWVNARTKVVQASVRLWDRSIFWFFLSIFSISFGSTVGFEYATYYSKWVTSAIHACITR